MKSGKKITSDEIRKILHMKSNEVLIVMKKRHMKSLENRGIISDTQGLIK